jgi:hypothetical protein
MSRVSQQRIDQAAAAKPPQPSMRHRKRCLGRVLVGEFEQIVS